jgi:septum formation protein
MAATAPPRLILASASPRRREILQRLGVAFDVVVGEVEELSEGDPEAVVLENARRKARAGRALAAGAAEGAGVLGVDTDVVLDGRLLGKPADADEARERLLALSGRTHEVLSGVVVLGPQLDAGEPLERSGVSRSEVRFRELEPATVDRYVASGEWRDRAGGYAIQGLGSVLVGGLHGDLSNVVGLPVALLLQLAPDLIGPGSSHEKL